MKLDVRKFLMAAAALTLSTAGVAKADQIDFSQFGGPGTFLSSPIDGTTTGGVAFTIAAPNAGATFVSVEGGAGAYSWSGNFALGSDQLDVLFPTGPITITFAKGISSLTGIAIQAASYGPEAETLSYYTNGAFIGSQTINQVTSNNPGTIVGFNISSLDITSVVLSTTGSGPDYFLGNAPTSVASGAPEPASWALMLGGLGLAGAMMRRRCATFAAA